MRYLILLLAWLSITAQLPIQGIGGIDTKFSDIFATSPGRLWIELEEDPDTLGGIEKNNQITGLWETLRVFKVTHEGPPRVEWTGKFQWMSHGMFDSAWVMALDSTNVSFGGPFGTRSNQVDLQTQIKRASVKVYGLYDDYPIWNGHSTCISLSTDDGNDDNMDWMAVADTFGVGLTAYIITEAIGTSLHLTWANVRTLYTHGWEIGLHSVSDGTPADYRRQFFIRLRPTGTAIGNISSVEFPSSNNALNVDDPGDHDGDGSFNRRNAGGGGFDDRLHFEDVAVVDTSYYGAIDQVTVYVVARVVADADPVAATNTIQVRIWNTAHCASCNSSTITLKGTGWSTYSYTFTDEGGEPWTWAELNNAQFGYRIVTGDSAIAFTQIWADAYYGGRTSTILDEHAQAASFPDTLLGWEIADGVKQIEDQLIPTDINYRCKTLAWPLNLADGRMEGFAKAAGIECARGGYKLASIPQYGMKQSRDIFPGWWYFEPMYLTRLVVDSQVFGTSASFDSAQVDSATTYFLDFYNDMANQSKNGGSLYRKNLWINLVVHDDNDMTAAQMEAFLNACFAHESNPWVAPVGEAYDYWRRAQELKRSYIRLINPNAGS